MKVDRQLVLHIAKLAHIELSEEEVGLFTSQLESIVGYVEKLNEVQGDVEPFHFGELLTPRLREDSPVLSLSVESTMKNAPEEKKNLFKVPRVIP